MTAHATILITGAGSGIGAAVARRLARQGQPLILHTGRNADGVRAVARDCAALHPGIQTRTLIGDLADANTVDALLAAADAQGALRAVVAAAGFAARGAWADLSPAAIERPWRAMVAALAALLQGALPRLAPMGAAGRFVAISSFVAHRFRLAPSLSAATASAKAGVEALVKAAAVEAAASGVTVNAVAPGYVQKDAGSGALDSAQWRQAVQGIPLRRLAAPDDIAGAVQFLLGPDAAYITGQILHVDGGLML